MGQTSAPLSPGRRLAFSLLGLLLPVLFVEGAARLLLWRLPDQLRLQAPSPLSRPYYRQQPWAAALVDAQAKLRLSHEPYRGLMLLEHVSPGTTVHRGERRTLPTPRGERPELWCCGGSTMFGQGARDEQTIPSALARDPQCAGWRVRNFGQPGWCSTQAVLDVLLRLRDGERPRVVLLYDGANDIQSAAAPPFEAGQPSLAAEMAARLRQSPPQTMAQYCLAAAQRRSAAAQLLVRWWLPTTPAELSPSRLPSLATEVAADYRWNVELLQAAAVAQGFRVLPVWQPTAMFTDASEQPANRARRELSVQTRRALLAHPPPGLVDLSRLFDTTVPSPYTDSCHLEEPFNAVVAAALQPHLAPLLRPLGGRPPAPPGPAAGG